MSKNTGNDKKKLIAKQMAMGAVMGIVGGIAGFASIEYFSENIKNVPSYAFIAYAVICFIATYFLAVVIHEGGHLVMGLATGYKFLSFRIGSFILVKTTDGLRLKRYSIAGTGGQCLLIPPDTDNPEKVPFFWYNAGGGLFNLLTCAISIVICHFVGNVWINAFFGVLGILSLLFGFTNLIPLNMGVANDGLNILMMIKSNYDRGVFWRQFTINALQTNGMRLKDMPRSYFDYRENEDSLLSAAMPLLYASRLMDEMNFAEAEAVFENAVNNPKLSQLHKNECLCELIFCKIVCGAAKEETDKLFDKDLKNYVKQSGKTMITRRKLMYAYYLICEKNIEAAEKEYLLAQNMIKNYPIKGELDSELEILEYVKDNFT